MNFIEVLKKYDFLGDALNYILKNSDSLYAPYHNLNHNLTVTVFSFYNGKGERLSKKEMEELLLAAIFHDFNHSAGKEKDDVNVQRAKDGVKDFVKKAKLNIDLDNVNKIIDATEFPYKLEEEDLNKQQQIIRDADMMQLFEPCRLQFNLLGMAKEFGVPYSKQLAGQKKFLDTVEFRTEIGKELKKKYWKEIMDELDYLVKIDK